MGELKDFKSWIYSLYGYEIRAIDLAVQLGYSRSELVSKWFRGEAYPSSTNCEKLSKIFNIPTKTILSKIYEIKLNGYNK
jgi:transcriptional regulator with XRE-family HTH domain